MSKPVLASHWHTGCGNLLQFQLWRSEPLGFVLWSALSGQQSQKACLALESALPTFCPSGSHSGTSFLEQSYSCILVVQVCRGNNNNTQCLLEGLCFCYSTNINYRWTRKSTQTPLNSGSSADFVLTAHLHSWPLLESAVFCVSSGSGHVTRCGMHLFNFCPFLIYSFSLLCATVTKNGNCGITLCSHLQSTKGWGCFWHHHR